jgi:hypothetical protein
MRGGIFHASSVVLPFLFVAAVEGFEAVVNWVGRRRRWNVAQARVVFSVALVCGAVILSLYVAQGLLARWVRVDRDYEMIGHWMDEQGIDDDAVVMANNPPGFWYHTRHPSVVIPTPYDDVEVLLAVVQRYDVHYVVLERDWPISVDVLYQSGLQLIWEDAASQTVLYEVRTR